MSSAEAIYVKLTKHLQSVTINGVVYTVSYAMLKEVYGENIICASIDNDVAVTLPDMPENIIRDAIIHMHTNYIDIDKYGEADIYPGLCVADQFNNVEMIGTLVRRFHSIAYELGKDKMLLGTTLARPISDFSMHVKLRARKLQLTPVVSKALNVIIDDVAKSYNKKMVVYMDLFVMSDSRCKLNAEISKIVSVRGPKIFTETQLNKIISIIARTEYPPCHPPLTNVLLFALFSEVSSRYLADCKKWKLFL